MIHRDRKYLLALLICCFVIPHVFLSTPLYRHYLQEIPQADWPDTRVFNCYIYLFSVFVPISVAVITLCHGLKVGRFSPGILLELLLIFLSFLPRMNWKLLAYMSCAFIIALIQESLLLIQPTDAEGEESRRNRLTAGFVKNRPLLLSSCFVSVSLVIVLQIFLAMISEWSFWDFLLETLGVIPIPLVLVFLSGMHKEKLTKGGICGLLGIMVLSCVTCTIFFLATAWLLHLCLVIGGFLSIFLMEIILRPAR